MNALRRIRLTIFKVTQSEMASIAGVTQATISRWENGVPPSLEDMRAIRGAASDRHLDWDDQLFFDEPKEAAE